MMSTAYKQRDAKPRLPLRVNVLARRYGFDDKKIPLPERSESNWLRVDTVWLSAEESRYTDDQLRALIWDIHRAGLRAAIDATSESAINQAIGGIEDASHRPRFRAQHPTGGVSATQA